MSEAQISLKRLYEVDELKLYFGDDFKVNEHITIHQPTIGEILEMGEQKYFSIAHLLTATPSDMIAQLHKRGIDWNKIEDFELFSMLILGVSQKDTQIFFGDLDFSEFQIEPTEGKRQHVLRHKRLGFVIDELMYGAIVNYIRTMHGFKKNVSLAGNEATRQMMIEMALEDLAIAQKKQYKSSLKAIISTLFNSPGFKYNLEEIRNMKFCAFMDSVSRIQIIRSSDALLRGCYSGMIDTKKINKKDLNFMRDIV